jgi:hypothetical protein
VTATVGGAVTEAEAAALLVTVLGATRLDPPSVSAWTEEGGSVAKLVAELVLRVRVLEHQLHNQPATGGLSRDRLAELAHRWGRWTGPPDPNASDRERGYRAAAAQICADLNTLIQESQ